MDKPEVPKKRYRAVIISPHLDDAVFSCGGAIAQMVKEGPVLVLNIFTRYLSNVKIRGVVLTDARYLEEAAAAQFLGFESRSLGELDVSFRRDAYKNLGNIFHPPVADDLAWLPTLRAKLFWELEQLEYQQLYVPLGIGWHVDHVLTHMAFDPWYGRSELHFYEDAPYCYIPHSTRYRLSELANFRAEPNDQSLAPTSALSAWRQASLAYANTALMRNLTPWMVRQFAVPAVSFYLHRLMALHRKIAVAKSQQCSFVSTLVPIPDCFAHKMHAMALYGSQFKEFFQSSKDCSDTLTRYSSSIGQSVASVERFWLSSLPQAVESL